MENNLNYYKAEVLKQLVSYKETTEKQLAILKSIKRVKKKDWTDFQDFLRNFQVWIGSIKLQNYRLTGHSYEIWNYETSVDIDAFYNLHHNENLRKKFETEAPERIVHEFWLVDHVIMTVDEFEQAIKDKISMYEEHLKKEIEAIEQFESDFLKISTVFDELVKAINSCNEGSQYQIRNAIEKAL